MVNGKLDSGCCSPAFTCAYAGVEANARTVAAFVQFFIGPILFFATQLLQQQTAGVSARSLDAANIRNPKNFEPLPWHRDGPDFTGAALG
jgi:hypothetical protein